MKNASIIFIMFLLWSCTSNTKPESASGHTGRMFKSEFDSITHFCNEKLDSFGLRGSYDTCKFWLYCFNVDDTVYFKKVESHEDSLALFSQLNLTCSEVNILNDTIEFLFHIVRGDSVSIDWGRTLTAQGVLYKLSENRPIGFIHEGPMRYMWSGNSRSPANNPLQPAIIKYIQANYSFFNPWFVARLKERKIVK